MLFDPCKAEEKHSSQVVVPAHLSRSSSRGQALTQVPDTLYARSGRNHSRITSGHRPSPITLSHSSCTARRSLAHRLRARRARSSRPAAAGCAAAAGSAGRRRAPPARGAPRSSPSRAASLSSARLPMLPVSSACSVRVAEHQVLHDEFDVDDAAAVVLEVEERAAVRDGRRAASGASRPLRARSAAGSRGWRRTSTRSASNACADRRVAGDVARARQRLVLPRPRVARLVFAEALERAHEQPARAVGPQPQVGLVEHAGGSHGGEQVVHALREPRVILGRFRRRDRRRGTRGRDRRRSRAPCRRASRSR